MRYKPQTALAAKSIPNGDCVIEPKFDGIRLLAETWHECGRSGVSFFTRNDKEHGGAKLPLIEADLNATFPADTVLDGELICPEAQTDSEERIKNWGVVQSVIGSENLHPFHKRLVFVVFDVLALGDHDARSITLRERRTLLTKAFDQRNAESKLERITLVPQYEATQGIHDKLCGSGWEGSIIKDLNTPYRSGKRGYGWWKLKPVSTVEGIITGFQDGKNGFAGMVGAIEFGQRKLVSKERRPGGKEVYELENRGKVSGFSMELREDMTANPEKYIGRVIEVTHEGVTKEGRFRFPRFCRFRDDKGASEVTWHDA